MLANHCGWAVGIVKVETPRIVPRLANKIRRSIAVIFLTLRTSGRNPNMGLGIRIIMGIIGVDLQNRK
jgi:hypothetical protein